MANWLVALGTLVLAAVAVFQRTIVGWFYRPLLTVRIRSTPPDCHAVPWVNRTTGAFVANVIYLRIWVENTGNTPARSVEVYARELRMRRADGQWEVVRDFLPMNLAWSHIGGLSFPLVVNEMGKHCDLGHIVDPAQRALTDDENPRLGLSPQECSLAFDLVAHSTHKGHVVGPGEYQLDIIVAAENARPLTRTVEITLRGPWYPDESRMLRDGVGVSILP
jgi:hypothetical protein